MISRDTLQDIERHTRSGMYETNKLLRQLLNVPHIRAQIWLWGRVVAAAKRLKDWRALASGVGAAKAIQILSLRVRQSHLRRAQPPGDWSPDAVTKWDGIIEARRQLGDPLIPR